MKGSDRLQTFLGKVGLQFVGGGEEGGVDGVGYRISIGVKNLGPITVPEFVNCVN